MDDALAKVTLPEPLRGLRRFALDGALLLFDRATGLNALCEGVETAALRQVAPRVVQFGITNRCNLTCGFCSRDLESESTWTAEDAFVLLRDLAAAGVLEVAFGGGEPFAFRRFDDLVLRLFAETPLAVNITTNGVALDRRRVRRLHGPDGPHYGQIRISLYDDPAWANDWRTRVAMLADVGARFGANLLVDPSVAERLEDIVLELCDLGCPDVVLLAYNGHDDRMHVPLSAIADLSARVRALGRALAGRMVVKLDVCWGARMAGVPQMFERTDCGAGREFLVITSDRRVMPCSFHDRSWPIATASDVLEVWAAHRAELAAATPVPGCARVPDFGLSSFVRLRVTR